MHTRDNNRYRIDWTTISIDRINNRVHDFLLLHSSLFPFFPFPSSFDFLFFLFSFSSSPFIDMTILQRKMIYRFRCFFFFLLLVSRHGRTVSTTDARTPVIVSVMYKMRTEHDDFNVNGQDGCVDLNNVWVK